MNKIYLGFQVGHGLTVEKIAALRIEKCKWINHRESDGFIITIPVRNAALSFMVTLAAVSLGVEADTLMQNVSSDLPDPPPRKDGQPHGVIRSLRREAEYIKKQKRF